MSAFRLGLAGGVCTLLGIGMARFAYTPIIPALVEADWFTTHQAAYLGAVNLLGYLLGAAAANRATLAFGVRRTLGAALAVTVASFFACALNWGLLWYGFWRLACGVSGAMLVVVGAPAALSRVAVAERAATGALVFTGIGAGIMASGTLVPWLAGIGVAATWLALGLVAAALAVWAWVAAWSSLAPLAADDERGRADSRLPRLAMGLVIVAYGLDAVGFVPHTLFWVDYIARQLGAGLNTGSAYWVVFGIGAMCGPLAAGLLARRVDFCPALAIALGLKTLAVALPLIGHGVWALGLSSFLVGLLIPATVMLTSGAVAALSPAARQQQVWGWATLSLALTQAVAGYGMSWGYEQIGDYRPLFAIGALSLVVATLCAGAAVRRADPR